ncbi:MAG: flagellar hook protein FlgE [Dactylosporangium sp.]|nr:flagellar hook protein FlgE [Dactylosporangium sp.]NNJ61290.1 flagellar hook protein FlgE [Dactylosporangium sp.]
MLRSLFSGISGLRTHQQMMDVTGNNIANVNTTGFKASQTVFEDTLSQMIKAASAPRDEFGGTNPSQIGLGVRLASVTTSFTQGSAQSTGRSTDLMVSGDGFFVLRNDNDLTYTRAGAFSFDANGRLCNPDGMIVQGWPGVSGAVDTNIAPGDVTLPVGILLPPVASTAITISGNLPADTTSTTPVSQSITTYDGQGSEVIVTATWTRNSATSWDVVVSDGTTTAPAATVAFTADGSTPTPTSLAFGGIAIDISGVSSYAGKATIAAQSQDGSAMGSLSGFIISPDGLVIGTFTNGLKQTLAQIALANFNNPPGLEKIGETMFRDTINSGLAQLGQPGAGGRGTLITGSLEMSNVDLGQEFTGLIIAQRGFQANSKIISASDELLQDLVNMKR